MAVEAQADDDRIGELVAFLSGEGREGRGCVLPPRLAMAAVVVPW